MTTTTTAASNVVVAMQISEMLFGSPMTAKSDKKK
jgi:hypothetical protein